MFDSKTTGMLERVLAFSEARHNVLAGNIANLDTPGYRMRDLSLDGFQAQLREALEGNALPGSDIAGSVAGSPGLGSRPEVSMADEFLYHDDSTGNLETQVASIAKNQMQHNLAISIMASQFRLLQTAISERA